MNSQLPPLFIQRLQSIFPPDKFEELLKSFKQNKHICFRANTLKTSIEDFKKELQLLNLNVHEDNNFKNVFILDSEQKEILTHSRLFTEGYCYIQNLSSMIPAMLLNPDENDRVLDIAAAPGSKTTQLAGLMHNKGWISAVEINKSRFFTLIDNLKTQGIDNVHTYLMDGSDVWKKCPEEFDKILVDAPCSSESRFNEKKPESFAYWSEKKIREMVKKQKRLIFSAFLSLKPGGTMVYATCSFAPEENEQIIHYLLKKFTDNAQVEEVTLPLTNLQHGITEWNGKRLNESIHNAIRILPNDIMDGFFVCKIRKANTTRL